MASGAVGCRPDQIIIVNETASLIGGRHNFDAICNGKRFICSYQPTTGINCKEAMEDPAEQDANFVANANGTVKNTKTGLEWKVGPDKDMNWNEANSWVQSLNIKNDGWRMPTENELKVLYRKGILKQKTPPLLKATGWPVWAIEAKGSDARYFYFIDHGNGYWYGRDGSDSMRALAARSGKR